MTKSFWLPFLIFIVLLDISSGCSQAQSQASNPSGGNAPVSDTAAPFQPLATKTPTVHPAPEGAVLLSPVAFTPGKPAWVTVQAAGGEPLAGVSLLLNGQSVDTNARGQAVFMVPAAGAASLSLQSEAGQEIDRIDYQLAPNGVLCRTQALETVNRLVPAAHAAGCHILYAPAIVQPGQKIALLGTGFAGKPNADRAIIDGTICDALAGSQCALLVQSSNHLTVGAMKDIFVSTTGGDSDSFESDIAVPAIEWSGNILAKQEAIKGKLSLSGSALPALIHLTNQNVEDLKLSMLPGQKDLEADSVVLLPGGDDNFQTLTAQHRSRHAPALRLSVVPDAPELSDQFVQIDKFRDRAAWQTLDYALFVKLKRRCLAVEDAIRKNRPLSASANTAEAEKLMAKEQALSHRHLALVAMLKAREAIFRSHGATVAQVAQAIDDATGGAYYVLESQVRALNIVPDFAVIKERTEQATQRPVIYSQLPEPRFKLWPPIEDVIKTTTPLPPGNPATNPPPATPTQAAATPTVKQ